MLTTTRVAVCGIVILAGCGGTIDTTPTPTRTPPPTITETATRTHTHTATPTATPTLGTGANIGFIGVLRADNTLVEPAEFDAQGRPMFHRMTGSGWVLVVEAKPGTNGAPVGASTFDFEAGNAALRPDLQVLVSRDLGNGSMAVCDNQEEAFGGVPGTDPPAFDDSQEVTNAVNDLGCRFIDGAGQTVGRQPGEACILFPDGEYRFVDPATTVGFCGFITLPLAFPVGETIVTARVRDTSGQLGPERQIVVHVAEQPTPPPTLTPTQTRTPTITPTLGTGANIGYIGLLRADNTIVDPDGADADGRTVFVRPTGSGFVIVIDAKPGTDGYAVGNTTLNWDPEDPAARPDLQVEVSRDLGDGSPDVCDNTPEKFGGVPGIDPPDFEATQEISDALNDMGCRFQDGAGSPEGRSPSEACVLWSDGEYHPVDPETSVEFCASVPLAMRFPDGDTVLTARVRNQEGVFGPTRQIVVRIPSP